MQPIAVDEDYAAQDAPIIDAWLAIAIREEQPEPLQLLFRQPE